MPHVRWVDVCRQFAAREGIASAHVEALAAFGYPNPRRDRTAADPPPTEPSFDGTFEELEALRLAGPIDAAAVAADLAHDVDDEQAQMFARRLVAVDDVLSSLGDPTGRLLRVGLRTRLLGIRRDARPRALRVRALADFYYSYAGLHRHARSGGGDPDFVSALPAARLHGVAPGVTTTTVAGRFAGGPVRVNILRVEPGAARLQAVDLRDAVAAGVPFVDTVRDAGAIAAVSGGFFLYSETGIDPPERRYDPVGLLVSGGEVVSAPVFPRGALVGTADGGWDVQRIGPASVTMRLGEAPPLSLRGIVTRATASHGPDEDSLAVAGRTVVAVGRSLRVPVGGFVLRRPATLTVAPGDVVRFDAPRLADGREVRDGIAGGPLLVQDGAPAIDLRREGFWGEAPPVTFSQDETGDRNLLPRLAAGIDDRGGLVLAAIDGRNVEHALGMTLRDVARLMVGLRCVVATNLDGGSSKRMVVGGQTLDLPSTEIAIGDTNPTASVRPVFTGLLLHSP